MRTTAPLLLMIALLTGASCAGPEPGDTGYVVLDQEARTAGLAIDTGDGNAPRTSALPIPVSAHDTIAIVGNGRRAPLVVAPGETVEVKDARGTLVRGASRADRLVVSGGRANVVALAQMLGATTVDRADGRIELAGPDVLLAASLYGDVEGIDAVSVLLSGAATESAAPWVLGDTSREEAAALPVSEDRIGEVAPVAPVAHLDPASLVGLYEAQGLSLLVDAAGGYTLNGAGFVQTGTWSVSYDALVLVPAGGTAAIIHVSDGANELREDSGVVLRAPGNPGRIIHDRVRTAFGSSE